MGLPPTSNLHSNALKATIRMGPSSHAEDTELLISLKGAAGQEALDLVLEVIRATGLVSLAKQESAGGRSLGQWEARRCGTHGDWSGQLALFGVNATLKNALSSALGNQSVEIGGRPAVLDVSSVDSIAEEAKNGARRRKGRGLLPAV